MVFMEVSLFIFKQEGFFNPCPDGPGLLEFTLHLPRLLLTIITDIAPNDLLILLLVFPNTSWEKIPTRPSRLS
jgi:hypothetical protein